MNGAQELLVAIEHDLHVTIILLSVHQHHMMPPLDNSVESDSWFRIHLTCRHVRLST